MDNLTAPTDAQVKEDLQNSTTKFCIEMFHHGYSLGYNYAKINNLNADINLLYTDLDRLVWFIRGRYIYGLPINQEDIKLVNHIRSLIEQKQSLKSDAKNLMWVSGIFAALSIGAMILGGSINNDNK